MNQVSNVVAAIWVVLLIPMNVYWFIDYRRFLRHLRENHAEHWHSIGSPGVLDDEPTYKPYGFIRYFFGRKYSELGSEETTALGDRVIRWQKWMFASWLVLAAVVLGSQLIISA